MTQYQFSINPAVTDDTFGTYLSDLDANSLLWDGLAKSLSDEDIAVENVSLVGDNIQIASHDRLSIEELRRVATILSVELEIKDSYESMDDHDQEIDQYVVLI